MSEALRAWILDELDQRKWSRRELARQATLSHAFVNRVLSGDLGPSVNFCQKIAVALGESPETVLRLAGILSTTPPSEDSPMLQEIIELTRSLPSEDQKEVLDFVRWRRYQRRKG